MTAEHGPQQFSRRDFLRSTAVIAANVLVPRCSADFLQAKESSSPFSLESASLATSLDISYTTPIDSSVVTEALRNDQHFLDVLGKYRSLSKQIAGLTNSDAKAFNITIADLYNPDSQTNEVAGLIEHSSIQTDGTQKKDKVFIFADSLDGIVPFIDLSSYESGTEIRLATLHRTITVDGTQKNESRIVPIIHYSNDEVTILGDYDSSHTMFTTYTPQSDSETLDIVGTRVFPLESKHMGVVIQDGINFREDPSTSKDPISTMKLHTEVEILDGPVPDSNPNSKRTWFKVKVEDETEGYISTEYIKASEDTNNIDTPDVTTSIVSISPSSTPEGTTNKVLNTVEASLMSSKEKNGIIYSGSTYGFFANGRGYQKDSLKSAEHIVDSSGEVSVIIPNFPIFTLKYDGFKSEGLTGMEINPKVTQDFADFWREYVSYIPKIMAQYDQFPSVGSNPFAFPKSSIMTRSKGIEYTQAMVRSAFRGESSPVTLDDGRQMRIPLFIYDLPDVNRYAEQYHNTGSIPQEKIEGTPRVFDFAAINEIVFNCQILPVGITSSRQWSNLDQLTIPGVMGYYKHLEGDKKLVVTIVKTPGKFMQAIMRNNPGAVPANLLYNTLRIGFSPENEFGGQEGGAFLIKEDKANEALLKRYTTLEQDIGLRKHQAFDIKTMSDSPTDKTFLWGK